MSCACYGGTFVCLNCPEGKKDKSKDKQKELPDKDKKKK